MSLDPSAMTARWSAGGHGQSDPMGKLRRCAEWDIDKQVGFLPGHGVRREDEIALYSTFILVAAGRLALVTDRLRAASALRRLATMVEHGQLDGVAS